MWSCKECDFLDKSRKVWDDKHYCYRYGCNKRIKDKYICFWCVNDSDLKKGGCSDFKHTENEQLKFM